MKPAVGVIVLLVLIGCASPYLLPSVYLKRYGIVTDGRVTAKLERIDFYQDDDVRHVLEVTYQYVPADTRRPETSSHQVGPSTYDRLGPGSPVKVRYAPLPLVRSLHIVALGSVLADTSWRERLPHALDDNRVYFDLSAIVIAALVGFLAWQTRTHEWCVPASFFGAVVASAIVPVGFIAFPVLFGASRKWPGKGYGLALIAAMAVCIPVLYWRIPHTAAVEPGSPAPAVATVRQISTVHRIWSGRDAGEGIPLPFQMVDLEFIPQGGTEPVHALDRVDLDSMPGLRAGSAVPVRYSVSNTRHARIEGATRTYREKAVRYFSQLTFGGSVIVVVVLMPLGRLAGRVFRPKERLAAVAGPERMTQYLSGVHIDDLRRKAFERFAKLPSGDARRKQWEELSALSDDDLRRKILERMPQLSPDGPRRKAIEALFRKRG